METTDIGWSGLAASLVLVGLTIVLSLVQRLGLEREILWATLRAGVQLLLVGVALVVVLDEDTTIALSWLWVITMVTFTAFTVRARARAVPGVFWVSLAATSGVAIVSLGVIFGMGIFPLTPSALVPLAGMMIGNAMGDTVLAANRVVAEIDGHRGEVEARLALGQPSREAARPYLTTALRNAITPQIERTKAVGIVILPGAMTGLILAGVDPTDAVLIQLAVMYLILGSVATSVTIVGTAVQRTLFTRDHRLIRLPTAERQSART